MGGDVGRRVDGMMTDRVPWDPTRPMESVQAAASKDKPLLERAFQGRCLPPAAAQPAQRPPVSVTSSRSSAPKKRSRQLHRTRAFRGYTARSAA